MSWQRKIQTCFQMFLRPELNMTVQFLGHCQPREGEEDWIKDMKDMNFHMSSCIMNFKWAIGALRSSICLEMDSDILLMYVSVVDIRRHLWIASCLCCCICIRFNSESGSNSTRRVVPWWHWHCCTVSTGVQTRQCIFQIVHGEAKGTWLVTIFNFQGILTLDAGVKVYHWVFHEEHYRRFFILRKKNNSSLKVAY